MTKGRSPYGDPFSPDTLREDESGISPDADLLLKAVDLEHPSAPAIIAALREVRLSGAEVDESAVRIAVSVGRQRWESGERMAAPSTGTQPVTAESIVYYIRRGAFIKIGTTRHPRRRFTELMPDEILAFEPGTHRDERMRHRQFVHLRRSGEYFRPAPELLEHAARVRAAHGDPDPSWPVTGAPRPAASPRAAATSAPEAPAVITGPEMLLTRQEAAEVAHVDVERIRTWERRGHLERTGLNEAGQPVYTALAVAKAEHKLRAFTRVAA